MAINTTIGQNDNWEFKSSPNFNKIYVDGLTGSDGDIIFNGVSLSGDLVSISLSSGNWDSAYVASLSSQYWNVAYTLVKNNSADWASSDLSSYATITLVNTLTGNLQTQVTSNSSDIITAQTNINDLTTLIQNNSAANWDNTGLIAETTVNTLTGNLQNQITSNDNDISDLTTVIQTNSAANWNNTGLAAESWVQTHFVNASGDVITGDISTSGYLSANTFYGDGSNLDGISAAARRYIIFTPIAPDDEVITGDGQAYAHIPSDLNNLTLVEAHAKVITAGTTGTLTIQVNNTNTTNDLLSATAPLTIDSGDTGSDTSTSPVVIDTAVATVSTNNFLRVDVDTVQTATVPLGLIVTLGFE